jgi:hypothetical protein
MCFHTQVKVFCEVIVFYSKLVKTDSIVYNFVFVRIMFGLGLGFQISFSRYCMVQ